MLPYYEESRLSCIERAMDCLDAGAWHSGVLQGGPLGEKVKFALHTRKCV